MKDPIQRSSDWAIVAEDAKSSDQKWVLSQRVGIFGKFRYIRWVALLLFSVSLSADEQFVKTMQPFFQKHCIRCHGPEKEKGSLRIDKLSFDPHDLDSVEHFQNILDEITINSMPPEDEPQPDAATLAKVSTALREYVAAALQKHHSTGGRPVRRLTKIEYTNTVLDLLGVHIDSSTLPDDGAIGVFDTEAQALYTTDMYFENYMDVARDVVRRFIASRNKKPRLYEIPQKLSQDFRFGRFVFMAENLPPAGHLVVRMKWWQRDPKPENRIFDGPTTQTSYYEVFGTPDDPQQIDIEFFEPKPEQQQWVLGETNVPWRTC